ncbi:YlxR family protein [Streptomyces sp. NPDC059456]|uniref:YlxR family protein n=1 Tax=Streptomyces sp. NPDC059456 TaxID=3346838 RepID=UPI0036780E2C
MVLYRAHTGDGVAMWHCGEHRVPDPRGTLPGRGAYLHPAVVCLDKAVRRRAFPRALRSPGALDTAGLSEAVAVVAEATP